jgi:hypothetical protein
MSKNKISIRDSFCSRSSLAKPVNSKLSYKERIALTGRSKQDKGVDFSVPISPSGHIRL